MVASVAQAEVSVAITQADELVWGCLMLHRLEVPLILMHGLL